MLRWPENPSMHSPRFFTAMMLGPEMSWAPMRLAANVDLPGSNHMEFVTGKGHRPDRKSTGTHRTTSVPRIAGAGIRLLVTLLPALAMGGYAVKDGLVDAGTVRTETLELMET